MVYEQSLRDENSIEVATASVSGYCLDLFSSCDAEIAATRELALSQLASISSSIISHSAPSRTYQPSMSFIASLHSNGTIISDCWGRIGN